MRGKRIMDQCPLQYNRIHYCNKRSGNCQRYFMRQLPEDHSAKICLQQIGANDPYSIELEIFRQNVPYRFKKSDKTGDLNP